jgi:phytoene dehydrogenase-like protein
VASVPLDAGIAAALLVFVARSGEAPPGVGAVDDEADLLIVGAGIVGCTVAERAATLRGWRSLVVDRRSHVGGNCHDALHDGGVRVQTCGPHYFRTDSDEVPAYLSRFSEWSHDVQNQGVERDVTRAIAAVPKYERPEDALLSNL